MTSYQFQRACTILRWSAAQVAKDCGYPRQAAVGWAGGTVATPQPVALWLTQRLAGRIVEPPSRTPTDPLDTGTAVDR